MKTGKRIFLQLEADTIRNVNTKLDKDRVLFTRKAMIRCGLDPNQNGIRELGQRFPHLQEIGKKCKKNFDGTPKACTMELDGCNPVRWRIK